MNDLKVYKNIEKVLIIILVLIVTCSVTKVFSSIIEDKVTKSTCSALNGVYVVGTHAGQSYCDYRK